MEMANLFKFPKGILKIGKALREENPQILHPKRKNVNE
jgi:hypothetical protein